MDLRKPTWVVLEGGGAKGSYSCGVLTELERLKANCAAVAGSSAGALNAVALSTHQLDQAKKAWESLTIWKILTLAGASRWSRIPQLLFGIFVALPCVFINILGAAFSHRGHFLGVRNAPVRLLALGFILLNTAVAAMVVWPLFLLSGNWGTNGCGVFYGVLLLHLSYNDAAQNNDIYRVAFGTGIAFAVILLPISPFVSSVASYAFGMLITYFISFATFGLGAFLIELPSRTVAIMGRAHLALVLNEFLTKQPIIPCFVTIAALERTIDREGSVFVRTARHHMDLHTPITYQLNPHYEHVPIYRDISRLRVDEAVRTIIASTSLPLGIAGPFTMRGISFEDGGLADNCPLLPLLIAQEVRQVLVVMLSPPGIGTGLDTVEGQALARASLRSKLATTIDKRLRRDTYREFCRRLRLRPGSDRIPDKPGSDEYERVSYVVKEITKQLSPSKDELLDRFDRMEILVVAPNQSLGNFVTGTLAFWPARVRALFEQGVVDAKCVLAAFAFETMLPSQSTATGPDGSQF